MTARSKTQIVKIGIFKVDDATTMLSQNTGLFSVIKQSLSEKSTAASRLLKLSEMAEDQDLLSSFSLNENSKYIFGTMMHLIPESESGTLSETLLQQPQVTLDEVKKKEGSLSKILTDYFYFALNDRFLLISSSKKHIESFERYLDCLVEKHRKAQIKFLPQMELPEEIAWENLKTVELGENSKVVAEFGTGIFEKTTAITKELLRKLMGEAMDSLSDTDLEQIVSAKLVLSVKGKTKVNAESYEKVAAIFAKPLENKNALVLTTKDGKKITGDQIESFKKVPIPTVSNGNLNEVALKLAMERILAELE